MTNSINQMQLFKEAHDSNDYVTHRIHRTLPPISLKGIITFIDLFSGIGGFHLGLEHAARSLGFEPHLTFASDICETANDTYEANFGHRPLGDIHKIPSSEGKGTDLIFGGFPCQPFSNSGLKKGLTDERGTLFFQIERLIKDCGPRAFVLENVAGLLTNGKGIRRISRLHAPGFARIVGPTMQHLEDKLEALDDYEVAWADLDSSAFGSPQIRKRVFIVGIKKSRQLREFRFPSGTRQRNTFRTILEEQPNGRLDLNQKQTANILKDMNRKGAPSYRDGMRRVGQAYHCKGGNVGQAYHIDGLMPTLTKIWTRFLPLYLPSLSERIPTSVFEEIFKPGPHYGSGRFRKASVRECLRLQGFPDDFIPHKSDAEAYEHIGNAVHCEVVRHVLLNLIPCVFRT